MDRIKNLMISLQINQRLFREIINQMNEQNIRKQFELIIEDNERVINELTVSCRQHLRLNINLSEEPNTSSLTLTLTDTNESQITNQTISESMSSANDLVIDDNSTIEEQAKRYRCQWPGCDYKTKFTANMDKHLCKHSNVRRYACDWPHCHKTYKQSNALVTHKRSHLGLKPFVCDFVGCHYRTNNRCSLPAHRKTHTGVKPFPCHWPQCLVTCSTITHLRDHQMSHRKEKPFKCDVCQQCFTKKSNMSAHKQSVHFGVKRVRNKTNSHINDDIESNYQ